MLLLLLLLLLWCCCCQPLPPTAPRRGHDIFALGEGAQLTVEEWNRVLAVNLTGPMLLAKATAEALAASGGVIVNIGSTRAHMSEPNTEACAWWWLWLWWWW